MNQALAFKTTRPCDSNSSLFHVSNDDAAAFEMTSDEDDVKILLDVAAVICNRTRIHGGSLISGYVCTAPDSFLWRREKHLSVPFRNAIFRGIIATERCCIA